jgi:hypothetical protein
LVTTLAESQAVTEYPDASQLSEAFAELVDCQKLAESLQLDPSETTVFNGCNVDCTTELCQTALMALGDPAKLTTDGEQTLQLSATGAAVVDDESRLVSFEGSWRGTIPTGEGSAVGGTIVGVQLAGAR